MSLKKTAFVVIALCALLPLTASATVTRVIGLGGVDANYIVKDAYNPSVWPQLIRNYGMQAGAEFNYMTGEWDFSRAYINYDFGEGKSVMQVSLDKYTNSGYFYSPDILDQIGGGYNKLNIVYGRPMGEVLVGLGLKYAGKSYKQDEDAEGGEMDVSFSSIGARLGVSALEEKLDLSLGFESASWSDEEGGETVNESDGASQIMFAGRYWHKLNDQYALIPNIKFGTMKDGYTGIDEEKASDTYNMFALGVGNNWTPTDNMLAIFELGLSSLSDKYENGESVTDSEMDIYWRLGFETKVFEWLDGRFGAERYWAGMTMESVAGKPEMSTNYTSTYLGASAHWNRLNLDMLVHPDFMGFGPNFVSGYQGMMFEQVSLKYNFPK